MHICVWASSISLHIWRDRIRWWMRSTATGESLMQMANTQFETHTSGACTGPDSTITAFCQIRKFEREHFRERSFRSFVVRDNANREKYWYSCSEEPESCAFSVDVSHCALGQFDLCICINLPYLRFAAPVSKNFLKRILKFVKDWQYWRTHFFEYHDHRTLTKIIILPHTQFQSIIKP